MTDGIDQLPERLQRMIKMNPGTGCWEWIGALNERGYGAVRWGVTQRRAHRVVFELLRTVIPEGLHLDHLCRVRNCVNPAHLEPVSPRENVLRGVGFAAQNALKTHCKAGHEFDEQNTRRITAGNGGRACRKCANEYQKARQKAERLTKRAALLGISVEELVQLRADRKAARRVRP